MSSAPTNDSLRAASSMCEGQARSDGHPKKDERTFKQGVAEAAGCLQHGSSQLAM